MSKILTTKQIIKIISVVIIALVISVVALTTIANYKILQNNLVRAPLMIDVKPGMSFHRFSKLLANRQIIENRFWLRLYIKLNPEYSNIKAGRYQLIPSHSLRDFILMVNQGKEYQYKITFVEGTTLKQWLALLASHPQIKPTLNYAEKGNLYTEVAKKLALKVDHPEGLFFPETYAFTQNTTDIDILNRANKKMQRELDWAWQNKQGQLPYQSPYEALIMASIIEKESGRQAEHDIISSVFVNRLHKKMRLQTDPTVIYGLGERYQGDIKRIHLKEKTAYNTYKINGLPPTPIAMPGKSAIIAAMQPAQTDFYYFVSDGAGKHIFSTNLTDHNKAVAKYQLAK